MRYTGNSTSTQSLPLYPSGYKNQDEEKMAKCKSLTSVNNELNTTSIESVCDFINNNEVFNILELPGLRYKGSIIKNNNQKDSSKHKIDLLDGRAIGQTVKLVLLNRNTFEINLITKNNTIEELLDIGLDKSGFQNEHKDNFCLTKKVGEEVFYLPPSDKVSEHAEHGIQTFYLALLAPFHHERTHFYAGTPAQFSYEGRCTKRGDSGVINLRLNFHGLFMNKEEIGWNSLKQVSFSHSFLQILYMKDKRLNKAKIFFRNQSAKLVHDLVGALKKIALKTQERNKISNAFEIESLKLEALCEQLFRFTKDAVKTFSTPKRKRSKSIDAQSYQRIRKVPKLNNSLSVSNVLKQSNQQPKTLYRNRGKHEIDQKTLKTPVLKPRRNICEKFENSSEKQNIDMKFGSRRTPIKMGTRSIAQGSAHKKITKERKIVCLALPRKEMLTYDICKTDSGIFAKSLEKHKNPKLLEGDRIVAVNGRSLEGCSLEKANFLLANTGHLVNLILSRISK